MRLTKSKTLLIVVVLLLNSLIISAIPLNDDGKSPFVDVVKDIRESVVNIKVEYEVKTGGFNQMPFNDDFFKFFFPDPNLTPQPKARHSISMGSGFIYKREGKDVYIITNNHVAENGKDGDITVTLADKAKYTGEIVGLDKDSDLAVIKIEVDFGDKVTIAPLGNSDDIEIGDWAIAIGNPFGLNHTLTVGIISAKGRSGIMNDASKYENFIQTDASINPGNSGGPLLNIQGEVIGINTAIASPSGGNVGIGFAIPINMAKKIMKQLKEKGKVERGWLGINIQDLTEDLAKFFKVKPNSGVLVADVVKNSPAKKAGFKSGDIIIEFDGVKITDSNKLRNIVAETPPYTKVKVKIIRKGKKKTLTVKLGKLPDNEEDLISSKNPVKSEWLGMRTSDITPNIARKFNVDEDESGVIVTFIKEGSVAAVNGLRPGDIIKQINNTKIKDMDDYIKFTRKHGDEDSFLLVIKRKGTLFYMTVENEEK
jgi:serine protease Do